MGDAIPRGTPPPRITVEVWTRGEGTELPPEQIEAAVADVVRIDDTWHVVVQLDD